MKSSNSSLFWTTTVDFFKLNTGSGGCSDGVFGRLGIPDGGRDASDTRISPIALVGRTSIGMSCGGLALDTGCFAAIGCVSAVTALFGDSSRFSCSGTSGGTASLDVGR